MVILSTPFWEFQVVRVLVFIALSHELLSTPFWEFQRRVSSAAGEPPFPVEPAFYSLLGVSGGSEEGVVCPILISTFLLPFGSFINC